MSTDLPGGTYYITNQYTGTVVTLTSGDDGTNLTCWRRYDGREQQWIVSLNNTDGQYIFQNVMYGNYISFQDRNVTYNPYTLLYARASPYQFGIEHYKGGFLIGTPNLGINVFNLAGQSYANDTPVIWWPFAVSFSAKPDNSVWYFNSTTDAPSSTPKSNKQTSSAGPIAGGVVGGVVVLICLLALAFYLGRRNRLKTNVSATDDRNLSYQTTPFMLEHTAPPTPALPDANTSIWRPGGGSVHKRGLAQPPSATSSPPDLNNTGTGSHDSPMRSRDTGIVQTVASSSSLPPASTAGSRATADFGRDPPPVYE